MVASQTRLKKGLQSEIFRINFDFFRLNKIKKKDAERQTHYAKKLDLRKKVRKKQVQAIKWYWSKDLRWQIPNNKGFLILLLNTIFPAWSFWTR